MAIHLIDISPEDLRAIQNLLKLGHFESVEQFVAVAVRNQLVYETQRDSSQLTVVEQAIGKAASAAPGNLARVSDLGTNHRFLPKPSWLFSSPDIEPLPAIKPTQDPLWGQYYRFLPLKLILRLLANAQQDGFPRMDTFQDQIVPDVLYLANHLRVTDNTRKQMGRMALAIGFPNTRKAEKSQARFVSQYIGRVTAEGNLAGLPAAMGFAALLTDPDVKLLGLTKTGVEFASLPNPILDNGDLSCALGDEEISFLLAHISEQMPGEIAQLKEVVKAVSDGLDTPKELDAHMRNHYKKSFSGDNWTDAKVAVMRSGAVSRLAEMGFIKVIKKGVRVRYKLAEDWKRRLMQIDGTFLEES